MCIFVVCNTFSVYLKYINTYDDLKCLKQILFCIYIEQYHICYANICNSICNALILYENV